MQLYAITIKPQSPFGTPLKGDTIFGQFCWQVAHDEALLQGGLNAWVECYPSRPFAIFSSAWPRVEDRDGRVCYALPRPCIPALTAAQAPDRKKRVAARKEEKEKKWILVDQDQLQVDEESWQAITDDELFNRIHESSGRSDSGVADGTPDLLKKPLVAGVQSHNSINRLTLTTGQGFDPFSMDNLHYQPGMKLVILVAIDDAALDAERVKIGLERIGSFGFGRDASTGLGRFALENIDEVAWETPGEQQGCFTLAPCVPEEDRFVKHFAIPFTRFGRHGDRLVLSGNPFKNPVVMADEGAVFFPGPTKMPKKPYIGRAVTGLSLAENRTIGQGYAIYLPMTRRS